MPWISRTLDQNLLDLEVHVEIQTLWFGSLHWAALELAGSPLAASRLWRPTQLFFAAEQQNNVAQHKLNLCAAQIVLLLSSKKSRTPQSVICAVVWT